MHLDREKYRPVDLLVSREGVLHADGAPIDHKDLRSIVDVVLNTLHGGAGEDGTIQKVFDGLDIAHTGAGSEKILNKYFTKKALAGSGVRTPFGVTFSLPQEIDEELEDFVATRAKHVFKRISPPWIVKPALGGSSVDTFFAGDFSELVAAIKAVLRKHEHVLVEEYVRGREISMGLIEGFRGEDDYFLMPAEIKKSSEILNQEDRARGNYQVLLPRDLDAGKREAMQNLMLEAKKKLGLKNYFTADFIITPFGIYLLEIDALPAIDEHAILPKSLEAIGSSLTEFLDHVLSRAAK